MSEQITKYDLIVIGAGPGGYVAALHAAHRGMQVACIDKRPTLGGTCLNVGCVPSKTLLQVTESYSWLEHKCKEQGIDCPKGIYDFEQMMRHKQQVVSGLTGSISSLFKKQSIEEIHGEAQLLSHDTVQVYSPTAPPQKLQATYILLATGSEPISLPALPIDEKSVLSSTGALELTKVPKKLTVVGGGVIGLELASVYGRLGSEITIVEMLDVICPTLDQALSKTLLQILKKQKMNFHLKCKVAEATSSSDGICLQVEPQTGEPAPAAFTLTSDVVLVAVGRRPLSAHLGLDNVGIKTTAAGFVPVDNAFRTSVPNIFAIGDLIDGPLLAHRASSEAVAVVEYLCGYPLTLNYLAIPNVIYTHPEVAVVGLTEQEAKAGGFETLIGTAAMRGNARARSSGEVEGLVKIIADRQSEVLLGMHIIGSHASEMICAGVLALETKMKLRSIAFACFPHPTLSESLKEAAMAALGLALHT